MKYFELDKDEKKILKDVNGGQYKSVKELKKMKLRYQQAAKSNLNKTKNVNIRLSEMDLQKIRSRAIEDGIPYQTLMSSILHKYLNDKLKTKA